MEDGPLLLEWLKALGKSQRQLALALGISPGAVTAWVKGSAAPTNKNLNGAIEWLGITKVQFHGGPPAPKKAVTKKSTTKRAAA